MEELSFVHHFRIELALQVEPPIFYHYLNSLSKELSIEFSFLNHKATEASYQLNIYFLNNFRNFAVYP
jgi:D-ribose pyranose/furanose isomerase RbsD